MEIFVCSREFFYESPGETILKITPYLPKLLSNIKGYTFFLGHSVVIYVRNLFLFKRHKDYLNHLTVELLSKVNCCIFYSLSRSSWQRDCGFMHRWCPSICPFVCLAVTKMQKKTRFSQKLCNLELWCVLTTYRKSYMGFSQILLLDP